MQEIDWTSYGLAVLTARRKRRLKQAELAAQLGISRVTLSYIERGTTKPRWKTLEAIAVLLDVHLVAQNRREDEN